MSWQKAQAITPRDYFHLASHKFPQRGSFLEGWKIEVTETYYRHGLIGISFLNSDLKHIVIVFQMIGDVEISIEILNLAKAFAKRTKDLAQNLGYPVSYTGKYLGGTVAELCAIEDKLPCYTFDSESIYETNIKK